MASVLAMPSPESQQIVEIAVVDCDRVNSQISHYSPTGLPKFFLGYFELY